MKKSSLPIITALALSLSAIGPVQAGSVNIPHEFVSGTKAKAAEVNENFSAVKTAVDDNNSNLETLQATVSALQSTVTQLQADLTMANNTISQLQTDLTAANNKISDLQGRLATVEGNSVLGLNDHLVLTTEYGYPTAKFTGVNVQIVNGSGQSIINGLGNLIVGYNEEYVWDPASNFCSKGNFDNQTDCETNGANWAGSFKTGSHNLVVGNGHSYSQYGGVVFGSRNVINRAGATVKGGAYNRATGAFSSVSGGTDNTSSGDKSSVSGGWSNLASGEKSSVSGGKNNKATGESSSVSGGLNSTASGAYGSVSGGKFNFASGLASSVSGGYLMITGHNASGDYDWRAGSLFEDQ